MAQWAAERDEDGPGGKAERECWESARGIVQNQEAESPGNGSVMGGRDPASRLI